MRVFSNIIKLDNYNKMDGIYYIKNKKIQIIKEVQGLNHYDDHNVYNKIRVFNNRYKDYDVGTHQFKK
jgi:hypothetical protein